jgi:taurine transport system substrate-binding protein
MLNISKIMKKERSRFSVLAILSLVLLLTISACGINKASSNETSSAPASSSAEGGASPSAADLMPKEVNIGFQVIPNAELLSKQTGRMEKAFPGVKINWVQFDSGRDVNTAMASSSIDLGLIGSTGTSSGIANNLPYQVYFLHDIIGDNEALVVKESSGIQSVTDLKGKTIAVPFGSTTHFSLLMALQAEGIDTKDVKILDMQPADMFAAYQRGDIDGGFVWHPSLGKMAADGGKIITSAKKLSEKGIITADVGIVRTAFADKYADFMKQYVAQLDASVKEFQSNPEAAAEVMSKAISSTPEDTLIMMKELVWKTSAEQAGADLLGTKDSPGAFAQVLKDSADFLVTQKSIQSAPELDVYKKAVRNEFLQP